MRALFLMALLAPALLGQHWTVQYFYDEDRTRLQIVDLAFPSADRGIAAGIVFDRNPDKKPKFTTLITSDGGAHWTLTPFVEEPRSLFFLNDSLGWMVTDKGIWVTEESGRSWRKIAEQKKPDKSIRFAPQGGLILRVAFFDAQHGFAVGYQKAVLETHDGGKTWTPVAEAAKPAAQPAFSAYTRIALDGPHGFISGSSVPPRPGGSRLPAWIDPERAAKQRQQPTLTIVLETRDRGATWKFETAPIFGTISSVAVSGARGLTVVGFDESFEFPSEVHGFDMTTGQTTRVFREKDRRVTSALILGEQAYLAAVEPPGRLTVTPVPGKVKMLTSKNMTNWTEMPVDYKAVAGAVLLAGSAPDHLWAATDTGMILHLVP